MIYITQGCDFTFRIRARRLGYNRYANVSWTEISSLVTKLINMPATKTAVSHTIDDQGRLIIPIDGSNLACNTYGIEMTGYYNNGNWRHHIAPAVEIVNNSTEENYALNETDDCTIDFSITLGETYVSTRVFDNEVKKIDKAAQDITRLQEDVANAGKVDDVKVNGVSVVSSKEANISIPTNVSDLQNDSEFVTESELEEALGDAGHVDDVKVNGSSVVTNKVANITVPTNLSDLLDDSSHRTVSDTEKNNWNSKQDAITGVVSPTVTENGGSPAAYVTFENGQLGFEFANLKGEKGDKGDTGEQGDKGEQGDSAVFDPDTGNILATLESNTGTSTTNAMTQKATTEMLDSEVELYEGWAYTIGKYYNTSNTVNYNSAFGYTTLIPLESMGDNDKIRLNNLANGSSYKGGYYYDSEKNFISGKFIDMTGGDIRKADMPAGAAYIRLNFSGTTYPTIAFIRCGGKRLNSIEDRLNAIDKTIITVTSFSAGLYIKTDDGSTTELTTTKVTGYIALNGATAVHSSQSLIRSLNKNYGQENSSTATIAFYDENKNFINSNISHNKYAECPANAAYIRCTVPASASETVITLYNTTPTAQINNLNSQIAEITPAVQTGLSGKTVAFIGDSITQASGISKPYHQVFADLAGCTAVNLGVNATTIASNPANNMGSDRFITRATAANLAGADMVVVFGGTNDFSYDTKPIGQLFTEETITASGRIGEKRLVAPNDTDTFAGALHELILQIRSIIGEKPIVFMTPLNRGRYTEGRPTTRECNVNGDYLIDFVDAIKQIGRFYGIPVFDAGGVMNFDPTDRGTSSLSGDLLHPNQTGHTRLGTLLYKWVTQNLA